MRNSSQMPLTLWLVGTSPKVDWAQYILILFLLTLGLAVAFWSRETTDNGERGRIYLGVLGVGYGISLLLASGWFVWAAFVSAAFNFN